MIKAFCAASCAILSFVSVSAQTPDASFNAKEAERIERFLSADSLKGRKVFSPGLETAGNFIASEFKNAGLQPVNGASDYHQSFTMIRPKFISAFADVNGQPIDQKNIVVMTSNPDLQVTEKSGYVISKITAGSNLYNQVMTKLNNKQNNLVLVDTSFAQQFGRLTGLKRQMFQSPYSTIFLLTTAELKTYSIAAKHEISESKLANIVGVLPGKSKKDEFVIFSGHYDHIGTGKPVDGDSIFNGANDDAAGTTAVIMLAKYFAKKHDNERTLIFAAFTAEESGGYGSQYFSRQFDPAKVMAMFNIEMIGTESKWGKNSAYITGYEKTDMGKLLDESLKGTEFHFYPDPYTSEQLFYRSDNATLARQGVPAHTISTSKMDNEPNYHKVSDEIGTLDMANMTMIIRAIAVSASGIISGKQTPSRVNTADLN
jgi:Peptidase family M28